MGSPVKFSRDRIKTYRLKPDGWNQLTWSQRKSTKRRIWIKSSKNQQWNVELFEKMSLWIKNGSAFTPWNTLGLAQITCCVRMNYIKIKALTSKSVGKNTISPSVFANQSCEIFRKNTRFIISMHTIHYAPGMHLTLKNNTTQTMPNLLLLQQQILHPNIIGL